MHTVVELKAEIERLEKIISNIHWMLQGEMNDEGMRNLRSYVLRKQ